MITNYDVVMAAHRLISTLERLEASGDSQDADQFWEDIDNLRQALIERAKAHS